MSLEFLTVHLELILSVGKFTEQFVHGSLLGIVLIDEVSILGDEFLIFLSLVRVKFIQPEFHLLVNALKLVLDPLSLLLILFSLNEDLIQLKFQFLVVVFHMVVCVFDIFRTSICSQFVKS